MRAWLRWRAWPEAREAGLRLAKLRQRVVEKGVTGVLEAASRRAERWTAFLLGALLARLPAAIRARILENLKPTVRLDYQREEIQLYADSTWDLLRAKSCAKEPHTVSWLELELRPGDVLFDVGANVGTYSLIAVRQHPGKVSAYAFEPSFSTYAQLCRNVMLNECQATIYPYMIALGRETGMATLNYWSLDSGASMHAVGRSVDYAGREFEPVYRQQVMVHSLDDLVERYGFPVPQLIKIDVDGTELDILVGAQRVLEDRRVRSLMIEVSEGKGESEEVFDLLRKSGFDRAVEMRPHNPLVSDYLFSRAQP